MNAFVADNQLNFPRFRKTPRAHEALNRRDRQLSSRLRHLLLLIDRSDTASHGLRQSLMTQENVDALLRLSLIEPIEPAAIQQPMNSTKAVLTDTHPARRVVIENPAHPLLAQSAVVQAAIAQSSFVQTPFAFVDDVDQTTHPQQISTEALIASLEQALQPCQSQVDAIQAIAEIQQLMVQSLRQACGLLAAGLMREIDAAQNFEQLRRCQGRWKMTLLDSRFDRGQIDQWIDQVSLFIRSH